MSQNNIKTIGILGGGQLGRMSIHAASMLGYAVHIYSPTKESPTAGIAAEYTVAPYEDKAALQKFAEAVDVVSFEFENVPYESLEFLEQHVSVFPSSQVIKIGQNRIREKDFINELGIGTAPYERVSNRDELEAAVRKIGIPCILKTTEMGYDGKGQQKLNSLLDNVDLEAGVEYVLEGFVPFSMEISVIVARGQGGEVEVFDAGENVHKNHILDVTIAPARISAELAQKAKDVAVRIAEGVDLVGVLAVELFVVGDDLLVNEIAPRPHNSGHHTIDACEASQFEQLIRAVAGLELGSPKLHSKAEMKNLIGDDVNDLAQYEADESAYIHLYGKNEVRAGRKMGHVTTLRNGS